MTKPDSVRAALAELEQVARLSVSPSTLHAEGRQRFNTAMAAARAVLAEHPINPLDALLTDVLNSRTAVEQKLYDIANGKLPVPDAEGFKALGRALGNPASAEGRAARAALSVEPEPVLPTGWKIERKDDFIKAVIVTAPNGYSAVVSPIDRIPNLPADELPEPVALTFAQWADSLTVEQKYDFDSEGCGYKKDCGLLMRMAWDAATEQMRAALSAQESRLAREHAAICMALRSDDTDWDTSYWNQAVIRCADSIRSRKA